jgi:hypothetical protein
VFLRRLFEHFKPDITATLRRAPNSVFEEENTLKYVDPSYEPGPERFLTGKAEVNQIRLIGSLRPLQTTGIQLILVIRDKLRKVQSGAGRQAISTALELIE